MVSHVPGLAAEDEEDEETDEDGDALEEVKEEDDEDEDDAEDDDDGSEEAEDNQAPLPVTKPNTTAHLNGKTSGKGDDSKNLLAMLQAKTKKKTATKAKREPDSSTQKESDVQTILIDFYRQYKPEKVSGVADLLSKFKGKELMLVKKLEAKYGLTPGTLTSKIGTKTKTEKKVSKKGEKVRVKASRKRDEVDVPVFQAAGSSEEEDAEAETFVSEDQAMERDHDMSVLTKAYYEEHGKRAVPQVPKGISLDDWDIKPKGGAAVPPPQKKQKTSGGKAGRAAERRALLG